MRKIKIGDKVTFVGFGWNACRSNVAACADVCSVVGEDLMMLGYRMLLLQSILHTYWVHPCQVKLVKKPKEGR